MLRGRGGRAESLPPPRPLDRIRSHLEIFFLVDRYFDLLGDEIPPEHTGRGRPPHVVTTEKRLKVMLLLALEKTEDQIAAAIGITAPTLRKHYFRQLKVRGDARLRLDGEIMATLAREAAGGNVGALKELNKMLESHDHAKLAKTVANRQPQAASAPPAGKKEKAKADAGRVAGIYAPPPQPRLVN